MLYTGILPGLGDTERELYSDMKYVNSKTLPDRNEQNVFSLVHEVGIDGIKQSKYPLKKGHVVIPL